ncbi:DUF3558 domain-containing protein [Amycolatopsis sp. YIM 10]|uniref:DUF3558 domain-containing protein n=1 Tax=Amycolatopsis sp. YIM 10 TaxID=2653857 RepID=UPI0012AA042D|nr:DUF3558 domain-containing protein [Amycolatopsis sp. YIM 10]QFU94463.1 hypothetical protein YIM_46685 [Amycolatopsis sp. YIM 10]
MSTRLKPLACLAAGLATVGCGSAPEPAPAPATSADAAAPALVARPAELRLDGIDPCTLFTEPQLDELKITEEPEPLPADDQREGPTCSLPVAKGEPHYTYYVEAITGADLEAWLTGDRRKSSKNTEPGQVERFPALTHHGRGSSPSDCETLVGVAQGQTLRVQLYPVTRGAFDQRQLCELSAGAAALAVRTLGSRG